MYATPTAASRRKSGTKERAAIVALAQRRQLSVAGEGGRAGKAHGSFVGMHLVGLDWMPCK